MTGHTSNSTVDNSQQHRALTATPRGAALRVGRLSLLCVFSVGLTVFAAITLHQRVLLILFAVLSGVLALNAGVFWASYLRHRHGH